MKPNYFIAFVALLASLFIYLFFRIEKTVVNEIFISVFSYESYEMWKKTIQDIFPLSDFIIFNLPEALWVFSATIVSNNFYLTIRKTKIDCAYIPLLFAIGLEILQLIHVTNGRFDILDIVLFYVFWLIAYRFFGRKQSNENIFQKFSIHTIILLSIYAIVFLAHVWK